MGYTIVYIRCIHFSNKYVERSSQNVLPPLLSSSYLLFSASLRLHFLVRFLPMVRRRWLAGSTRRERRRALIGCNAVASLAGCHICKNKVVKLFPRFSLCGARFRPGNIWNCVQKEFIYTILKNYPVCWWGSTKSSSKGDRLFRPHI